MEYIDIAKSDRAAKFYDPIAKRTFIIPLELFDDVDNILQPDWEKLNINESTRQKMRDNGYYVIVLKDGKTHYYIKCSKEFDLFCEELRLFQHGKRYTFGETDYAAQTKRYASLAAKYAELALSYL